MQKPLARSAPIYIHKGASGVAKLSKGDGGSRDFTLGNSGIGVVKGATVLIIVVRSECADGGCGHQHEKDMLSGMNMVRSYAAFRETSARP